MRIRDSVYVFADMRQLHTLKVCNGKEKAVESIHFDTKRHLQGPSLESDVLLMRTLTCTTPSLALANMRT